MTSSSALDPRWFRQVLGQYPTGVSIITAIEPSGVAAGMAVGSFTSVSLDPPLVAFLADRGSTSWPRIERAGTFCVNILAADQEALCRQFSAKGGDKFGDTRWRPAGSGAPILGDALAWIDCAIERVHDAGDHYIVVGRVRELDIARSSLPLLFFRGGYGRFTPQSLVTGEVALLDRFRDVDVVRPELETLARDLAVECDAGVRISDEIAIVATAGEPTGPHIPTRIGHRYSLTPPLGALFLAWAEDSAQLGWLDRAQPQQRTADARALKWICANGYSLLVGRLDPESALPDGATRDLHTAVRGLRLAFGPADVPAGVEDIWISLNAPVFDASGGVSLQINLHGFDAPIDQAQLSHTIRLLLERARKITHAIGGRPPPVQHGEAPRHPA